MMRYRFLAFFFLFFCVLSIPTTRMPALTGLGTVALAQNIPATAFDSKLIKAKLEKSRNFLNDKEKVLNTGNLAEDDLVKLREQVQNIATELLALTHEIDPRMEALKQRLDQLGAPPTDTAVGESADVTNERTLRQTAIKELAELQKITAALSVQAQQFLSSVTEQRRLLFSRSILQRSNSILSPLLWKEFFTAFPEDLGVIQNVFKRWNEVLQQNYNSWTIPLLLAGILIAALLYIIRLRLKVTWVARDSAITHPSLRQRLFASFRLLIADLFPIFIILRGFTFLLEQLKLYPQQLQSSIDAVQVAIMLVFMARCLNDILTSPRNINWQVVTMGAKATQRLRLFTNTLYGWISLKIVIDAFYKTITASIPLTLVSHAAFAFLTALMVLPILRTPKKEALSPGTEEAMGEYDSEKANKTPAFIGVLRTIGWISLALICASLVFGYLSFASFIIQEAGGVLLILGFTHFFVMLVDESVNGTLKKDTGIAFILQNNIGIQKRSLEQIGIVSTGLFKFAILSLMCLILLARLRIESTDITGQIQTAFYGFKIGNISISLSSIIASALILLGGLIITRMLRNWLDNTYFPVTNLDAGLRNSILTMCGYVGTGITLILASSYVGLSLDKLAIVAGALSVGIGFGLQSIVNNFVSGLILLWERPIRVGDWVSVGGEEGYVRNIKVRATEIQTFDRATVIVPNSSLISGIVVNNVRLTRMRRVSILIPLPRHADADNACLIMRNCALAHLEVMSQPATNVYFKNISETAIELQLICFVDDVDSASRVASELRFSIFRELRAAALLPTAASPTKFVLDVSNRDTDTKVDQLLQSQETEDSSSS